MATIPLPALDIRPPAPQPNPVEQYAHLLQLKQMQQLQPGQVQLQQEQLKGAQLQNQGVQQDIAARQALNDAYKQSVTTTPDGKASFDPDKLQSALANSAAAYKTPEVMENLTKFQKTRVDLQNSTVDLQQKQADMAGSAAAAVKAANYDPTLAHSILDTLPDSPQVQQMRQMIDSNPQQFHQIIDSVIAKAPSQQKMQNERDVATIRASGSPERMELDAFKKNPPPGYPPTELGFLKYKSDLQVQQHVAEETNPEVQAGKVKVATAEGQARANIQAAIANSTGAGQNAADVAKKFGMNPVAFDQAAEKYWTTGQLPPTSRGGPGQAFQKAVMNRAGELHPEGSLAANSAEYKANEDSLKKLQANFDQVTAFESTANKNLDLFVEQAKKVVDTGSPWANKPLRMISRNALGSDDQAAYDTARQVAVNEIAKVTGSPGLSGQLSDSARHEVSDFNPQNATLAQTLRVAQVLRQDMANRHQSYAQQIQDIKGRLGGGGAAAAAPAAQSGSSAAKPGEKPVYHNGTLVGYTADGKTMRPAQ